MCGTGKVKGGGSLGPAQFAYDSDKTWSAGAAADPESLANTVAGAGNAKIEGKAGLKLCLPPPPR